MEPMRRAAAALVLAIVAGCDRPAASAGAGVPPTKVPVGPVPGPSVEPPPPTHPLIGDAGAVATGRQLFVAFNCAGCHGEHGGGGMGPSLRDDVWIYGGRDGEVFGSIADGRANGMPAWGTLLGAEQIWLLTAYVQSLRTPLEPDPPRP